MHHPLVSVVIPTYGRSDLILEAIASCAHSRALLAIEIIVVDDGSPISLEPFVASQDIVFHRLAENSGSSVARNVALSMAQGRYVKFLDSDDTLTAGALALEVSTAERTGADIVVAGWRNVTMFEGGGSQIDSSHSAPSFRSIADDLLAGRAVPTGAALYRRASVQGVRWDARLSKLNDWDYFVQAALASTRISTCDVISYDWRAHPGERITSSRDGLQKSAP